MQIKKVLSLALILLFASYPALSAETYTYDFHGNAVMLKSAYSVAKTIDGVSLGLEPFSNLNSSYVDARGFIYLADSGNGRIVVLKPDYTLDRVISIFTRPDGSADALVYPTDVAVSGNGDIYVADQKARRIVVLGEGGELLNEITKPVSDVLGEDFMFTPTRLALSSVGGLYVVAQGVTEGIMEMSQTGEITRFVGAAKVKVKPLEYLWKLISTDRQRAQLTQYVPTEYNNLFIDPDGFIYGTISTVSSDDQKAAMQQSLYNVRGISMAPATLIASLNLVMSVISFYQPEASLTLRKINIIGNDILRRRGYSLPAGDVEFETTAWSAELTRATLGASALVDVAVHPNGVYSILDQRRGRVFSYDESGVLLYAFGGIGSTEGAFLRPTSLSYCGDDILVTDAYKQTAVVFAPTDFVRDIFAALDAYEADDYDLALSLWRDTVEYCSNFDVGHIGIGRALLRQEDYKGAMDAFRLAQFRDGYDAAFQLYRRDMLRANFAWLIIALALVIGAWVLGAKLVSARRHKLKKRGYFASLRYALHISVHPFDGFYDMRAEGGGSLAASFTLLALYCACAIARRQLTGFIFNTNVIENLNIPGEIIGAILPIFLFVIANWSMTTLLDGDGSMKYIFMTLCYSLLPTIIIEIVIIALSNVLCIREIDFISVLNMLATLWTCLLAFFGLSVTHGYTLKRNLLAVILSLVGMIMILFLCLLFFSLIETIITFLSTVWKEFILRS